jgi:hypothetical protein
MDGCAGPAVECLAPQDHCTLSNTSTCVNDAWTCVEVFKTCELEGYVCKSWRYNPNTDCILLPDRKISIISTLILLICLVLTSGDSSDGMCKMDGCAGPAVECLTPQDHCTLSNTSACVNDTWTCVEVFKTCELEGYVCKSSEAQFKNMNSVHLECCPF